MGWLLGRRLARALNRDGQASALQSQALAEGSQLAEAVAAGVTSRGRRRAVPARAEVEAALAQKVLGAWLQNRHQTLYPLALNLRNLQPIQVALLLDMVAAALLAGAGVSAEAVERAGAWLASVGASPAQRASLGAALAANRPLPPLLDAVLAAHLGPFAYAVALAAVDQRQMVNRLFLDYLAVRLAIPGDVARSLAQRYRL